MSAGVVPPLDTAAYASGGYLVVRGLFGAGAVAAMRAEADRLLDLVVDASLRTGEVSPRLDVCRRGDRVSVRKIQPLTDISPVFAAIAADPRLTGVLAELLSDRPVLIEEKLNYKQLIDAPLPCERAGDSFDYHHDHAYFAQQGYPAETLTVGIMVDANTVENGALRVLPGSQRREWRLHEGNPLLDEAVDETAAVDVVGEPGDAVVFTSRLVHASPDNRTEAPRRLLLLSYHPAWHGAEPDVRNRPLRERATAHEARAAALAAAG